MSNISDTLESIRLANNLYSSQINSLVKSLQLDIDQIVSSTQFDLINKISHDYNISLRELTRKYIVKTKKVRKNTDDDQLSNHIDDNKINEEVDNDEELNNDDEISNTKKIKNENVIEDNKKNEMIFKPIHIKNVEYLLNIVTNEIFTNEHVLVGRKQGDKYLIKKNI